MRTRLYPTSEKQVFHTIGVPDPLSPELDAHTTRVTALISDNFSQIRAFEMTGLGRRNLLDVINVNVSLFGIEDLESIKDQLVSYFIVQKRLLKLQASIGFIYQTSDQELGYFRPSPNSGTVLQTPVLIPDVKTLIKKINEIEKYVNVESVQKNAPKDSATKTIGLCQISFFFFKTNFFSIGGPVKLPRAVINLNCVHGLTHAKKHKPYNDELCLFRCLALARQRNPSMPNWKRMEKDAIDMFKSYCLKTNTAPEEFFGFPGDSFYDIEKMFNLSIHVYRVSRNIKTPVSSYTTQHPYGRKRVFLLQTEHHMSYIHDIKKFVSTFLCEQCGTAFNSLFNLKRHQNRHCPVLQKQSSFYLAPGGTFKPRDSLANIFERHGIKLGDGDQNPVFCVYDFEARQISVKDGESPKTSLTTEHVVASVYLACNLYGNSEEKLMKSYFVAENDSKAAADRVVQEFYFQLKKYAKEMKSVMCEKYDALYDSVQDTINQQNCELDAWLACYPDANHGGKRKKQQLTELEKALAKLRTEHSTLKAVSFNGGKYDLNLIQNQLIQLLAPDWKGFVKKGNNYTEIHTKHLRLVDIRSYVDPGYSASAYQQVVNYIIRAHN